MNERNLDILTLFAEECKSLGEIGKKYNLSRESVRQILNRELLEWQYKTILKDNIEKRRKKSLDQKKRYFCPCGKEKSNEIVKVCFACHLKRVKKHYTKEDKRKAHKEQMKRYRLRNLERFQARNRAYYLKHKKKAVDKV